MPTKPTVDNPKEASAQNDGDKTQGRRQVDADRRQQDTDRRQQDQDRRDDVAVAAYFNAERRGFAEGGDVNDWFKAEREIDGLNGTAGAKASESGDGSASATVQAGEKSNGDRGHDARRFRKAKPKSKRKTKTARI